MHLGSFLSKPFANLVTLPLLFAASSLAAPALAQDQGTASPLFAADTPPEVIEAAMEAVPPPPAGYSVLDRWPGSTTNPATITWSLVPDGVIVPGDSIDPTSPNTLFATLDSAYAAIGGRAQWIADIESCFARWDELSGVTFVRVTAPGVDWDDGAPMTAGGAVGLRGDIRVTAHAIDAAQGVLGYSRSIVLGGDFTIDDAEDWGNPLLSRRFLRNALSHLIGRSLGLGIICSADASFIMENVIDPTSIDGPQHDDIRGIQRSYGDPFEQDETAASAVMLGTLPGGTLVTDLDPIPPPLEGPPPTNTSLRSLDVETDDDWIQFDVAGPSYITIQVTPRGFSYNDYVPTHLPCQGSTATTDSLVAQNLALQIVGNDGVSVVAEASSQPAGSAESVQSVLVVGPRVFVHIFRTPGTVSQFRSQLYSISIGVQDACSGGSDCNGNSSDDFCDLLTGISADINGTGVPDECEGVVGTLFCFGDQSDFSFTPCPCDNAGSPLHGCANSAHATGAQLWASGTVAPTDTVELNTFEMPATAVAIFLKGDVNNVVGASFGDGVRCVDGNLIRLGARTAVNGAASYPGGSGNPVSVRGQTPVGSGLTGYYQTYYRNAAAAFCPPETFNVSNGAILTW